MWNIFLLERNISSTYVLFAENIKIKSPGWISSLITFIIYHLITYYGCMQANNFQGGKQIFFKRSIHNIRWSWPRLVLSHVMYIFTVIIHLTTGTRIPDPPPFFSSFGPSRDYGMDLCLEVYLWTIYPYFTTFRVTTLSFY